MSKHKHEGERSLRMTLNVEKRARDDLQMALRGLPDAQREAKMDPRCPKMSEDGPKMSIRWAEDGPR